MTIQVPRPPSARAKIAERKSAVSRWSLRASLAAFLFALAYVIAAIVFHQAGLEPPPWTPAALAISPGIGLILAGGGAALNLIEMLRIAARKQEFDPWESSREFALDDASELLGGLRQGCLARAVVPLALIASMAALLLQLLSLPGSGNLQVMLESPPQSCAISIAPFTIELDNSASAVASTWSAAPVEVLPNGALWAQVQPAQGTVQGRQRERVQVVPNGLVCRYLSQMQHLTGGQMYAVLLLATDAVYHVRITSKGHILRTATLAMQISGGTVSFAPSPTPTRTAQPAPRATATRTPRSATPTPSSTPTPTPRPITPHASLQVAQNQDYSENCASSPASAYTITLDNRASNVPIDWQFIPAGGWASASPSSARIGAGQTATLRVSPSVCPIGADSTTYQATLHLGFPRGGSQPDIALSDVIAGPPPHPALEVTQNQNAGFNCPLPAAYTITIDNLGGNVPVTWQFVPVEYNGGVPWAIATPPSGTLAAGQGATTITIDLQPGVVLDVTYNATLQLSFPAGGSQANIPLTYTATCLI